MNKLDSMWWHEEAGNGKLASSHIAVVFCALVRSGMIVSDLLEMEFEGIPNNFADESISPMEYCLAYTDGVLFDMYIKPKFRKFIVELHETDKIYEIINTLAGLEHDPKNETYTLKCTWKNVDTLTEWLQQQGSRDKPWIEHN